MSSHALCFTDEIPENTCKGFRLNNHPSIEADIFIVKKDGQIHLYRNHCPHLGLPLEWMPHQFLDRDNHYIQCATHGALFQIHDGTCISGPCLGESLTAIPFQIIGKSVIISTKDINTTIF